MSFFNLAWTALALTACLMGTTPPDVTMTGQLFTAMILLALTGLCTRGLGLFLAMIVPGFMGLVALGCQDQWEMIWTPLYFGTQLAVHNLGSGKSLNLIVASSQALIVAALVPTLTLHFSPLAILSGLAGITLAALAAIPYSI